MTDCIEFQGSSRRPVLATLFAYYKKRNKQRQNRAAFQHVLRLDPHILKDIGLNEGDVIWANSLPIEQIAALVLDEKVRHRKHLV